MIEIYAIGKNKDKALTALEKEYCKRISGFTKINVVEFKDETNDHVDRENEVLLIKEKEGQRVLSKIKDTDFVVLLDLHGKMMDSESFAQSLSNWQMKSSHIVFVIAGSLGPSQALVNRANVRWKLSDLTFTHLMTRVLILEQIYRGFMILNGRSYHK
ncbi:23S rRNA (pseudouridine(1915)-N(3))-methyltransferase RlmH [Floccifex sp.]|uniref:23S rRNA (pseudouridine(1915)-N(3))-methyltransferase RlmH n=1 Tax=Floccifex sp. TaxID=2815810 RepID=UPI002A762651|nr:23S rRNA (pseudouridine(1915)-N(3))-methyltransferase RlmH [Floccifex sp.]MDD7281635.1 23S rRNA (pseudouridine(1915)-N(3))-methyltransferase RlmH [Erysipelotrichaceae bacterium]MDY2958750.1 23S rRNA (pseudouridine(1915)-N(3))-methyltransferase RlmH [Floccifex sp.]